MGFVFILVLALAAIRSVWTVVRCVRVPRGPFPRCRGCGYSLVGGLAGVGAGERAGVGGRCPECGVELTDQTTYRAADAARAMPSARHLNGALVALAVAAMVAVGFLFHAWPWQAMWARGSSIYIPLPDLAAGAPVAGWMSSPTRQVEIVFDLEYVRGFPPHRGTLMAELVRPGEKRAHLACDAHGVMPAADHLGLAPHTTLDANATRALYRAAGLDADTDELIACEADMVHEIMAAILRDPQAGSGMTPSARSVGVRRGELSRIGGSGFSAYVRGDVIPLGAGGVSLTAVLWIAGAAALLPVATLAHRRRNRIVARLNAET